jgi:hypothetical protein
MFRATYQSSSARPIHNAVFVNDQQLRFPKFQLKYKSQMPFYNLEDAIGFF